MVSQVWNVVYSGNRITSVNSSSTTGMDMMYNFTYGTDGHVASMSTVMSVMGTEVPSGTMYFTWQSGNMVQKHDELGYYTRYTYDNHPTPYALHVPEAFFLAAGTPEFTSANNITSVETYNAQEHVTRYINWTYTSDGYPASNGRSDVGFNYYLYADGDGSTGSGAGGDDPFSSDTVTPDPRPDPNPDIYTSLVGTQWEYVSQDDGYVVTFLFVFNTTTTGSYNYSNNDGYSESYEFTYTYSNGSGTLFLSGGEYPFTLNITGNVEQLILDENMVFTRTQ